MEAAQVDSSEVKKDGAPDAAAAMSVDDIAGSFGTADRDTVLKALDSNPDLYQRVLTMSPEELAALDEKLKVNATKPGTDVPPGETPADPAAAGAETKADDEELTVNLKASDLGTYFTKGRSAQEAIRELVKGKKNADERIEFLKNEQLPTVERQAKALADQNQKLLAELEQLRKKAPAESPAELKVSAVDEDGIIPDDIDFFDPDQQKKVVDVLKQVTQTNSSLKKEIEALKNGTIPAQPAQQAHAAQPAPQAAADERVMSEFEAIRLLQKNPDTEGIFSTSVDVVDVERQNIAFMENLARQNGINGIFDASGRIIPAVSSLLDNYYDVNSPEGLKIRSEAEKVGLKPPDDLPALNRIYAIRNLRLKYMAANPITGNVEPIPYEEAHRLARATMPELFAQLKAKDPRSAEREAIAKGVEHRQQFAPDPKSASSAEMAHLQDMTTANFYALMKKDTKDLSPREVETLRKIFAEHGKMSEAEITAYFSNQTGG